MNQIRNYQLLPVDEHPLSGYSEEAEIQRRETTVNECEYAKNRRKLSRRFALNAEREYEPIDWKKLDVYYEFVRRSFQNRSTKRRWFR